MFVWVISRLSLYRGCLDTVDCNSIVGRYSASSPSCIELQLFAARSLLGAQRGFALVLKFAQLIAARLGLGAQRGLALVFKLTQFVAARSSLCAQRFVAL